MVIACYLHYSCGRAHSTWHRGAILRGGGAENAGLENAGLESDELRLKQPQTSSTIDVSELSQNCVGVLHEVVDVRVHFCSKVPYYESNFCRIGLSAETSP